MASVINTNMASLYAQKNLSGAQNALSTSVERLSSGLRINRAKDDAAGLGISEKIKSQVTSLNQGLRNANDAISMVQTAEGSLSEVSSILQRMKELSVQARNDSLSTTQRSFISDELVALKKEINAISERTTFNDLSLLKNALRTDVVGSAADSTALVNGAQLLDGLSVKGLALQNTNTGTYTFSAAKDTQIANQKSHAVGAQIGVAGTDTTQSAAYAHATKTLTLSGFFEVGDTIAMPTSAGTTLTTGNNAGDETVTRVTTDNIAAGAVHATNVTTGSVRYVSITLGGVTKEVDLTNAAYLATAGVADTSTTDNLVKTLQAGLRAVFDNAINVFKSADSGTISIDDGAARTISGVSFQNAARTNMGGAYVYAPVAGNAASPEDAFRAFAVSDAQAETASTLSVSIAGYNGNALNAIDVSEATDGVTLAQIAQTKLRALAGLTNPNDIFVEYKNGRLVINSQGALATNRSLENQPSTLVVGANNYIYTVTQENLTQNNDGRSAVISGGSSQALANIAASIASSVAVAPFATTFNNGGTTTSSGAVVTFHSVFGTPADGQKALNRAAGTRSITFADDDIQNGNLLTLKVGSKNYSVVVGTGETKATIADRMKNLLVKDYGTSATVNTNVVTLGIGAGVDVADMTLSVQKLSAGALITGQQSYVSNLSTASQAVARSVVIHDHDVVQGNQFTLRVGNPEFHRTFNVIADHDDTYATIAEKLRVLAKDVFGENNTTGVTTATADVAVNGANVGKSFSFSSGLNFGMSNIELTVRQTNAGDPVTVASVVSGKNRSAVARTVTVNQLDLTAGNIASLTVNGKEYATDIRSGDLARDVAYRLANLLQKDYPNTDATTATVEFPVGRRVDIGASAGVNDNVITLTSLAKVGLADITMTVKRKANAGDFTLTADANTGIGGTSQTINVGQIAAGGSKTFDFDNLGVQFTVANSRATAVDSSSFAVSTSKVNKLTVGATMNGEALFQVGAGTRDNVVLDGFKDIRITGYNQNTGAEKEVFDKISATLDTISQNTTASLSATNFATLENQIEDAITMVSDFRSYFGGQQNRIEFAISNIQAQSENLTAANSRIVDTDYAAETANLTKTQIMQQAATAMLAQANQMPNVILALLK